jgi:formylglycine-generating enzyme required for sulfatase activity
MRYSLAFLLTLTMCSPRPAVVEPRTKMPFVDVPQRTFFIGMYEVTQREWIAVMDSNPSHFRSSLDAPVEEVNWYDTQEFLRRLNVNASGTYRLPTEEEWEYACRAGTDTAYAFGDRLSTDDANYDGRYPLPGQAPGIYRGSTTPVGSFRPNRWGIYDMHGNVWEWCSTDATPTLKVIRGGSWYFNADSARCGLRYTHRPQDRGFSLGFRVVWEPRQRASAQVR